MELVLEVISYKGLPSVGGISARFTEQGGSIGRSADNHLALPDAEKLISRHHANIHFEGGVFVLQDVSTGGTWLCNEERWLSQTTAPLADGDFIKIGEYELRVRVDSTASGEFADFFGERPDPLASPSPAISIDPFNEPPPLPLGPLPLPSDAQVFPSFIGQPDASPFEESFRPPGIEQSPPPNLEVDFSIDNFFQDNFEPPLSAKPAPAPSKDDDFDLDKYLGDGLSLHEPAPAAPLPEVEEAIQPVLPEPEDIFALAPPSAPPLELKTEAVPRPAKDGPRETQAPSLPPLANQFEDSPFAQSFNELPEVAIPAQANEDLVEATPEKPAPAINIPKPGRPPVIEAESAPALTSRQPPVAPAPSVTAHPAPVGSDDLFRSFLEGAGLTELSHLTHEEQKKAMQAIGRVYREMVDGMMQVLLARKMEKSMISLRQSDVTQFRRGEYNPLKVFPTVEETMKEMVCQKNPAYIGPAEAVKEGFADIMKHQMAMRAGMQASMDGLLKRLAPKCFEDQFKEGIVFQKKAKCWDAYSQTYPKLVNETMDDLFGDAFAEAYREQLRILRESQR